MIKVVEIKLKEIIKKRGYESVSYRKLSEEMSISHVALWKMINGKPYNPSLEMLDKLCTFFKCRPGDILEHRKG
jgi:putative transcriptional regulator